MLTLRSLCQDLYERWLEVRCFLLGLRVAWVSTASALIGFLLFFGAQPAQDILLEVRNDNEPSASLLFWSLDLVVILFWALPVFVSARWILTRFEEGSDLHPSIERVPTWVRCVVPAFLAVLCFGALLAGQIMALASAPTIDENAKAAIADARRFVKDKRKTQAGLEACGKWKREECKVCGQPGDRGRRWHSGRTSKRSQDGAWYRSVPDLLVLHRPSVSAFEIPSSSNCEKNRNCHRGLPRRCVHDLSGGRPICGNVVGVITMACYSPCSCFSFP